MISRKDLRTELKWYRSYGKALRSALQKLPQGSLYYKMEHGAPRPYMRIGGREKYLPSRKNNLIRDLARRKDIEDSLRKVDQNIILLRQAEQSYYDYSVMYRYMNAGYWPYDNLITTFDFTDGGVDLTWLQRVLDLMILDPDQ